MLRPVLGLLVVVVGLSLPGAAIAQLVDLDLRSGLFLEPSETSQMRVLTPSTTLRATPWEFVSVSGGWSADVVSGASESIKAGPSFSNAPDIVSAASVTDFRQVVTGGVTVRREHTELGVSYGRGWESDYRSNTLTVTAQSEFFQRNTKIEIAFSHGFDDVCDEALNATQAPTLRQALDESKGCFTADERRSLDVSTDNFQGAWTQSWTPLFATQLVLTGAVQKGFLANPYRSVVIGPVGETAQEHHPENRARGAFAARGRYFVKPLDAAVGAGFRGYRDTWDIVSQTYELDIEKGLGPIFRIGVQGRYYSQGAAVFWSDDYAAGEPLNGPRGQYFSGDREVSPLSSLLAGARATASLSGRPGARIARLFLSFEASLGASILKTNLENFTLAGRDPDDTTALLFSANLTAGF